MRSDWRRNFIDRPLPTASQSPLADALCGDGDHVKYPNNVIVKKLDMLQVDRIQYVLTQGENREEKFWGISKKA
jgi:hypothetical protein